MANQFATTNWISMDVLRFLVNKLTVAEYFNNDWEKDFKKEYAVGSQIQVKFPQPFIVIDGMAYAPQGINRQTTTINLDQWIQVPFEFDDFDKALKAERSMEELRKQYLEPAGLQMAQEVNLRAARFAHQNSSNVVGALGTDPNSAATYYAARQRLMELACPPGDKAACMSSSMMSALGSGLFNQIRPGDETRKALKQGYIGELTSFDLYEEQSLFNHTAGTWAGAVTVTGAGQSGGSLIVTGTNGDTIKKGDKISIVNVNQVNPRTRQIPGRKVAKNFVVTQDFVLTGGADTITILPAIFGPGSQYQNVDALPANAAALTLWPGTSSPNGKSGTVGLAITKSAFALVAAKLFLPKSVETSSQAQDPETGLSVRFVHAWDPVRSMNVHRFDALFGFGNLYQDNACVAIAGA